MLVNLSEIGPQQLVCPPLKRRVELVGSPATLTERGTSGVRGTLSSHGEARTGDGTAAAVGVHDHLQLVRVADLEDRRPRLHDALALGHDAQYVAADG